MINVALPFIGQHFGVGEGTYGWVVSGYLLTFGVFSAIHGRLGDLFGVRRLYLGGVVAFAVGALASAVAPTIVTLIAVRVLQGAGAAAIPALGATIISRLFPAGERGAAMGAVIATVGLAASLSPFLGGLLLEWTSWRVLFLVPALGLLAVPYAWRVLPLSLDEVHSRERFDVVGAVLLGLGAAALLVATNLAEHGVDGRTLGVGGVGAALLVGFAAWTRFADEPFVPSSLFVEPRYVATVATGALGNAGRFGTIVLVPILLEQVDGASPFAIGAALLPGAVAMTLLSPLAGRLADRHGTRAVTVPGSLGILATCLATAWLVDDGVWGMAAAMTAFGAAFAFVQTPLLGSIGTVLPRDRLGIGNGLYLMVFFLGGAFGVAFSIAVLAAQEPGTAAWIGPVDAPAGRFANAVLALAAVAAVPVPLLPLLSSASSVSGIASPPRC